MFLERTDDASLDDKHFSEIENGDQVETKNNNFLRG